MVTSASLNESESGLTTGRKKVGECLIRVNRSQSITYLHEHISTGKDSMSNTNDFALRIGRIGSGLSDMGDLPINITTSPSSSILIVEFQTLSLTSPSVSKVVKSHRM